MKPNTIITRINPEGDGLDDLKIVAPSSVSYGADNAAAWVGSTGGSAMIVTTLEFGPNIDIPLDYLHANYKIVSVPEEPVVSVDDVVPYSEQPTAEQQFARQAQLDRAAAEAKIVSAKPNKKAIQQ